MIASASTPARSTVLFHNRAAPANPPLERPRCSLYVRIRFRVKHYSADAAGEVIGNVAVASMSCRSTTDQSNFFDGAPTMNRIPAGVNCRPTPKSVGPVPNTDGPFG